MKKLISSLACLLLILPFAGLAFGQDPMQQSLDREVVYQDETVTLYSLDPNSALVRELRERTPSQAELYGKGKTIDDPVLVFDAMAYGPDDKWDYFFKKGTTITNSIILFMYSKSPVTITWEIWGPKKYKKTLTKTLESKYYYLDYKTTPPPGLYLLTGKVLAKGITKVSYYNFDTFKYYISTK